MAKDRLLEMAEALEEFAGLMRMLAEGQPETVEEVKLIRETFIRLEPTIRKWMQDPGKFLH